MKTIKDIKMEDVQNLFDSIIFLRGEEYFEEGCVRSIEPINSCTISGIVSGNQNYNVSVSVDAEGDIICDCSCPCDFNCKHAAALLLKWLSIKDKYNKKLKDIELFKKESINQILAKKSKEELIELLETFIDKHPELKSLIRTEGKEIISKIKALFSNFWDWDEVNDLISQLETILEGIRRNKNLWNKNLLNDMDACSHIMINNVENVHDEGDLGLFLEDWFETYGDMFSATKPTIKEKGLFIQKIVDLINMDEYGLDGSYEKALLGMCNTKEDIQLIKKGMKQIESKYPYDEDHYKEFYLKLYDKIGMDDKYIEVAEQSGLTHILVDKLISLNRLNEALEACEKSNKKEFSELIENKKIEILKKLGNKKELKKSIFNLLKRTGNFNYFLKLKQECSKGEWKKYLKEIVSHSKSNKRYSLLSRIYYNENDFKDAYEYSKTMTDSNYLELLAKKLSKEYPELACNLFKKLCLNWIKAGSGWPYKKAGKMLEVIKKLDKAGDFFNKTKKEITLAHKKKYSLMHIIEAV